MDPRQPAGYGRVVAIQDIAQAGRGESVFCLSFPSDEVSRLRHEATTGTVHAVADGRLFEFSRELGTMAMSFRLPVEVGEYDGATVRLTLSGVSRLRYLAVGLVTSTNQYLHTKVKHIEQDLPLTVSTSVGDLTHMVFGGGLAEPQGRVEAIKIMVSGEASSEGVAVLLHRLEAFRSRSPEVDGCAANFAKTRDSVLRYLRKTRPDHELAVTEYLTSSNVRLADEIVVPWPLGEQAPVTDSDNATLRYQWHALFLVADLVLSYAQAPSQRIALSVVQITESWLATNLDKYSADPRYAWYDHGTAVRTIVLCAVYLVLGPENLDPRWRRRLETALVRHGDLLADYTFYAANQNSLFHNHAWFQDIALAVTARTVDAPYPQVERWRTTALDRFRAQVDKLVMDEGDVGAVFVENSIGYHGAAGGLIDLGADLLDDETLSPWLRGVAAGMRKWDRVFRYPDGQAAAQGDTYRTSAERSSVAAVRSVRPGLRTALASGYVLVDGSHCDKPWRLNFTATNLSSTHKHEDHLNITFWFDGVEWLFDPSFLSHDYTAPVPAFLRSAVAHSVPSIPALQYSLATGAARLDVVDRDDQIAIVRGEHGAYRGMRVRRQITAHLRQLRLEGTDVVERTGTHEDDVSSIYHAVWTLHLLPGVTAVTVQGGVVLSHPRSAAALYVELPPDTAVEVARGWHDDVTRAAVAGLGFQQLEDSLALRCRIPLEREFRWVLRAADASVTPGAGS
jgi:hypothetical protein